MSDTKWPGTPAEWDAELERRACAIQAESAFDLRDDAVVRWARATMPPRPVEPPNVVTASGWRVGYSHDCFWAESATSMTKLSWFRESHQIAAACNATEAEHDAIRALRDGPMARYEVCGWGVTNGDGVTKMCEGNHLITNKEHARRVAETNGGTAHATYRRVEGGK